MDDMISRTASRSRGCVYIHGYAWISIKVSMMISISIRSLRRKLVIGFLSMLTRGNPHIKLIKSTDCFINWMFARPPARPRANHTSPPRARGRHIYIRMYTFIHVYICICLYICICICIRVYVYMYMYVYVYVYVCVYIFNPTIKLNCSVPKRTQTIFLPVAGRSGPL